MATVRRLRPQPRAWRRGDMPGQADPAAAHVRLVPAVPGDVAGRRRVTRLIQGAVAGAKR